MNISQLFEDRIYKTGERVTLEFEGRRIGHGHVRERGGRLGNALLGLGIEPGEVVAVTMSNCPEVLEAFSGIFRIGAVVLPILFILSAEECRFMLEDAGAAAVITDFTQEQKVLEAASQVESVRRVIVVGSAGTPGALDYDGLLKVSSPDLAIADKEPGDDAMIMYTSGTTGRPKGVVITHNNLYETARSSHEVNELSGPKNMFLCLPLAHIYGVVAMSTGAMSDATEGKGVLMRWFDPEQCFRLIEEHRINVFPGVPAMFAMMLHHPAVDDYDLSSLEDCVSAASSLPKGLGTEFFERFGVRIRQMYGLTETCGMGAGTRPSHPFREGATGKAYPNLELAVFDDGDDPVEPGTTGEIVIRGPHVMKEYWNLPGETAEVLRDGWLHTGDVGHLDEEGFLYVTDRKKDLIIKGGENIVPAIVEEAVCEHPAVMEAAAIGVADEVYGEDVAVYVVLRPGAAASTDELRDFCSGRLPTFRRPREILLVNALPRSSVGKVRKRELRRMFNEGR